MFSRGLCCAQTLSSLHGRRTLTTLAASTKPRARLGYYLGVAVVGTVIGFGTSTYARNDEGGWLNMKEKIMTSYEARIRELSSPEKIFQVFASVKKDGKSYMTVDDFIRALIPHQYRFESKAEKNKTRQLPTAFKAADQNGDGLISFQEYLFFVTLLSIPERSFKVAFKLMDEDGSGKVDQQEFFKVMKFLKKLSPPASQTTSEAGGVAEGWCAHFFGPLGNNGLTLEAFTGFLKQLNQDVMQMEYSLYDKDSRGYLSQRDFGFLILSFANPRDFYDRAAVLDSTPLKPFSFDQFQGFNELIDHIDDVEMAMQLFQLNKRPFRKQDLQRLTRIVCKSELNQQVIDTIMRIFDKNGDGSLEINEFVTVIKKRKTRGLTTERDTGFTRSLTRIVKCIQNPEN